MDRQFRKFLKEYDYEYLNEAQREAVQRVDGATLLFSVPGSGKTTVIVARTGYMVKVRKIDPATILVITFTKAAAAEMKQRYAAKFADKDRTNPDFRTIHSLCFKVIREAAYECGAAIPEIIDNSYVPIAKIAATHGVYLEKDVIDSVISRITEVKNRMSDAETIHGIMIDGLDASLTFETIYKEYKALLRRNGQMDRDDLLVYAYGFMRKYPNVLERLQKKYRYVSVDEAQDTSPLQHRILECLCARNGNIFMVGDDDQSIYGFRGADPEELQRFTQRYENARSLTMNINYRSDMVIVDTAERFICESSLHKEKNMRAKSAAKGSVLFPRVRNQKEQIEYLEKEIQKANEEGCTIAVLFRQNVSGYALRYALQRDGINYDLLNTADVLTENRTIRDVLRLLDFALEPQRFELFRSCYSNLSLFLKKEELTEAEALGRYYPDQDILISIARHRPKEIAERLYSRNATLHSMAQGKPLIALNKIREELRYDKLNSAQAQLAFDFLKTVAADYNDVPSFTKRIREMDSEKRGNAASCVTLSTLHSCKGLEFDKVVIIDLIEDVIPGKSNAAGRVGNCVSQEEKKRSDREEKRRAEEEKRLFYVGVTRARHQLQLLFCERISESGYNEESSMLVSYREKFASRDERAKRSEEHPKGNKVNAYARQGNAKPAERRVELNGYLHLLYPLGVPDKKDR